MKFLILLGLATSLMICASHAQNVDVLKTNVGDANEKIESLSKPKMCADCMLEEQNAKAAAFEVCTDENSYLETLLPAKSGQSKKEGSLPNQCILSAQKMFGEGAPYFTMCKSKNGFPKERIARPCISKKYHQAVADAFQSVTSCFDVPARQLFSNLSIESGLHINALGKDLDGGISQLTGPTIDAVNRIYFQSYLGKAKKSAKCKDVLQDMSPLPKEPANRCAAIWPPKNPTQNLVYAAILFDTNSQVVRAGFAKVKSQLPADLDADALKEALEILSFNTAPGNVMLALRQYIKIRGSQLKAEDFKLNSTSDDGFIKFISTSFPIGAKEEPRRREVIANYLPLVKRYVSRIEKSQEGLSCAPQKMSSLF